MSGLVYHVVCPICGCAGPTLELGRDRSGTLALPAANLVTHELDAVEIAEPGDSQALARRSSTAEHPVAAAVVRGQELVLVPPLPCPHCAAMIDRAVWGDTPPARAALASLDDMIAATRAATDELAFTDRDERYDVICEPTVERSVHELTWRVRLRGDLEHDRRDELRAIVGDLAARLKAQGSAVSEPDVRSQQARLTERFTLT
jgi:hypothetical protein